MNAYSPTLYHLLSALHSRFIKSQKSFGFRKKRNVGRSVGEKQVTILWEFNFMPKFTGPLDHVKVAAPCPANWNAMRGNERIRFCSQCNLNVYNLSGMTKNEAETLLAKTEGGRLCVRYYRRADGSILTKNCPIGLHAAARKVRRAAGALLSAVLGFGAGVGLSNAVQSIWAEDIGHHTMGQVAAPLAPPVTPTFDQEKIVADQQSVAEPPVVMGRIAYHVEPPPKPPRARQAQNFRRAICRRRL